MMDRGSRDYDLVVWGATGFTGTTTCEYLAKTYKDLNWAIAGRNYSKLEHLKDKLISINNNCKDLDILLGDITDQDSLDEIVKQAKVVISTAGPYTKYGGPIVAACAKHGTDYCDLTGEINWMKKMIQAHNEEAKKSGAIILHACGMDSIPSDMGTFVVASHVKEKYGVPCEDVRCLVTNLRGGFSGGTLASICALIASKDNVRDPYYLVPNPPPVEQPSDLMFIEYDNDVNMWKYPYPLAIADNRLVRRSQYLLGHKNGEFTFSMSGASKSFFGAFVPWFLFAIGALLLQFGLFRWLVTKFKPAGSGPSKEDLQKGGFEMKILAKPKATANKKLPEHVVGRVAAKGDPGYFVTPKMLAESAVCLATQRDQLPTKQGGFYTPSTGLGFVLVDRLRRNAGVTIEVEGAPSFNAAP